MSAGVTGSRLLTRGKSFQLTPENAMRAARLQWSERTTDHNGSKSRHRAERLVDKAASLSMCDCLKTVVRAQLAIDVMEMVA